MQTSAIVALAVPLGVLLISLLVYLVWKRWCPRTRLGDDDNNVPDLGAKLGRRTCGSICLAIPTSPVFQWLLFAFTLAVMGMAIYSTWGYETLTHPQSTLTREEVAGWVDSNRTAVLAELSLVQAEVDALAGSDSEAVRANVTLLTELTAALAANLSVLSDLSRQLEAYNASLEVVRVVNASLIQLQSEWTAINQSASLLLAQLAAESSTRAAEDLVIQQAIAQNQTANANQTSWIDSLYGLYQSLQTQVNALFVSPTFTSPTFVSSATLTARNFIVANASTVLQPTSVLGQVTQYGAATFGIPISVGGVLQPADVSFGSLYGTVYFGPDYWLNGTMYMGVGDNQNMCMKLTPANFYDQSGFGPFVELNDNKPANPVYNHSSVAQFDMSGTRASKFFGPVTAFNGVTTNSLNATNITAVNMTVTGTIWARSAIQVSDRSKKTNIRALQGTLRELQQLEPVKFRMVGDEDRVRVGFIAQRVKEIWPDCVFVTDGDLLGIEPVCLVSHSVLLLQLLSEQQKKDADECDLKFQLCIDNVEQVSRFFQQAIEDTCKPIEPLKPPKSRDEL